MADAVQVALDRMVSDLENLEERGIFTLSEVTSCGGPGCLSRDMA